MTTVETLTTLSDTLLAQRAATLDKYNRYRDMYEQDRTDASAKELADYYLGIWRGLGDALKTVDHELAQAMYAAHCESVSA